MSLVFLCLFPCAFMLWIFFFFSSRRRHTRLQGDWSSDVCSSDLLPLNRPPERHSIHGLGWQAAWRPGDVREHQAILEFRHAAGAWPWAFRATQHFALGPASLSVELTLSNESETPMPAGLGWHPYFPRPAGTTITADVQAIWLTDDEVMPTTLAPPRPDSDLSRGISDDTSALDNCFVGWRRRA